MILLETTGYGYSKKLCEDVVCWFVSKHLARYKLDLEIVHRGLKREKVLGWCDIIGETYNPRCFLIELHTHMDKKTYVRTLIHELYHVLQFVTGELRIKSSKRYFKGECIEDLEYWQQPHEIFAYWNEKILYQEYLKDKNLTHP
jgi:tRNA U55 pseudouridine synthase TruB